MQIKGANLRSCSLCSDHERPQTHKFILRTWVTTLKLDKFGKSWMWSRSLRILLECHVLFAFQISVIKRRLQGHLI